MFMLRFVFLTVPHRLLYGIFWLLASPVMPLGLAVYLLTVLMQPFPPPEWPGVAIIMGLVMVISRKLRDLLQPRRRRRLVQRRSKNPFYRVQLMPALTACSKGTADYVRLTVTLPPALRALVSEGLGMTEPDTASTPRRNKEGKHSGLTLVKG